MFTAADSGKVSEHLTLLPGSSWEFFHWLRPVQFGDSGPGPARTSVQPKARAEALLGPTYQGPTNSRGAMAAAAQQSAVQNHQQPTVGWAPWQHLYHPQPCPKRGTAAWRCALLPSGPWGVAPTASHRTDTVRSRSHPALPSPVVAGSRGACTQPVSVTPRLTSVPHREGHASEGAARYN